MDRLATIIVQRCTGYNGDDDDDEEEEEVVEDEVKRMNIMRIKMMKNMTKIIK